MSFVFKPATREAAKLLIGLCGPSGSGKTLSALRLAAGLGGPIAYIDTEQGRATQYAGDYEFMHAVLPPPFSPERYREAVDAAVAINPSVVIVDSASHEWEGPGGILEVVDDARGSGNDFAVWKKPKAAHQKLVNRLLQVPAHVILCMRAKEKRGLVPDPKRPGKTEVVNLGWHPIAESGLTYELTINVLLSADRKGAPIVDGFDFGKLPYNMADLLPPDEQISEATGERMAAWARGDATAKPAAQPKPIPELDSFGAVVVTYADPEQFIAAMEAASVEKQGWNLRKITQIATHEKAPSELRARAEKLRERIDLEEVELV